MRSAKATAVVLILIAFGARGDSRRRAVAIPAAWDARLTLASRSPVHAGVRTTNSSSSLTARWSAPGGSVDHFVITASDSAGGPPLQFSAGASESEKVLDRLESATEYRVSIAACVDAACVKAVPSTSTAKATTEEEVWQIRGTGSSYATAAHVVPDGNTKAYALLWGADAGSTLAGRAQLYYDPLQSSEKGIKIGTMTGAITSSADSVASYAALSGYGFRRNDSQGHAGSGPATFQTVALSRRMGGNVRIFYEAADANGVGRVYSVDSVDGWTGRDFHSGASTICQESDLTAGAPCAATLLVGVDSDGNPKVAQARQLKVGLPTLDSWTWDGEPGTFMTVTLHFNGSTCSSTFFNMGYAVWDGAKWNLQYDASGCPKLIQGVQAPMPVHMGGARYKLYFNHNTTGSQSFKPMSLLYADGRATGSSSIVDFEDWEPVTRARHVTVVWPDGTQLTDGETSMFDDYHVWMPTNDPSFQVIYTNMSCPDGSCGAPFIGMAVLLNP